MSLSHGALIRDNPLIEFSINGQAILAPALNLGFMRTGSGLARNGRERLSINPNVQWCVHVLRDTNHHCKAQVNVPVARILACTAIHSSIRVSGEDEQ